MNIQKMSRWFNLVRRICIISEESPTDVSVSLESALGILDARCVSSTISQNYLQDWLLLTSRWFFAIIKAFANIPSHLSDWEYYSATDRVCQGLVFLLGHSSIIENEIIAVLFLSNLQFFLDYRDTNPFF